jgi:hypothetical protein
MSWRFNNSIRLKNTDEKPGHLVRDGRACAPMGMMDDESLHSGAVVLASSATGLSHAVVCRTLVLPAGVQDGPWGPHCRVTCLDRGPVQGLAFGDERTRARHHGGRCDSDAEEGQEPVPKAEHDGHDTLPVGKVFEKGHYCLNSIIRPSFTFVNHNVVK